MTALRFAVLAAIVASSTNAFAETFHVAPGDDPAPVFRDLAPGDELVFEAGEHALGQGVSATLDGADGAPIVVRGEQGAVLQSSAGATTLRLDGSFFELYDLEIRGPGQALALVGEEIGVRGITFVGATTAINCEDCNLAVIADCEFRALTASTGAAILSEAFVNGVITNNWIHDIQSNGIRLTGRTVNNNVFDNVVESVSGEGIRVEIPLDLDQANTVAGNFVADVQGDGIVTVGAAIVTTNIVTRFGDHGIWSTIGGGTVDSEASVFSNTVVGESTTCFRATDWSLAPVVSNLTANALYCPGGTAIAFDDGGGETIVSTNVFLGGADRQGDSVMGDSLDDFADADGDNFYPAPDSPLIDAAAPGLASNVDFNGEQRDATPDVGAYELRTPTNPGPIPGGGFKGETGGPPPDGADMGGDDAGGGGPSGGAQAGGSGFPDRDDGGCNCTSAGPIGAAFPLLLLLAFAIAVRRR